MGISDSVLQLSSTSISTTLGVCFPFRLVCATSGSGVVNALNAELSVSSPIGTLLTLFCFAALILLIAFCLPFPVVVLAFTARDLGDFALDVVDWLASRFCFVMVDKRVDKWGWGIIISFA